jgi:hypothetical protein
MTNSRDAIQQFTETTNAAVSQARLVAQDTAAQINAGTYGCEDWCRSMVKLFDIVARGSATHFQTAVSHGCCGTSSCEDGSCGLEPSDQVRVDKDKVDNDSERAFSIVVPFTRVGGTASIPSNLIAFKPNTLAAGAKSFSVRLLDAQYIGASYTGTVRLTRTASSLPPATVDQLVTVEL